MLTTGFVALVAGSQESVGECRGVPRAWGWEQDSAQLWTWLPPGEAGWPVPAWPGGLSRHVHKP